MIINNGTDSDDYNNMVAKNTKLSSRITVTRKRSRKIFDSETSSDDDNTVIIPSQKRQRTSQQVQTVTVTPYESHSKPKILELSFGEGTYNRNNSLTSLLINVGHGTKSTSMDSTDNVINIDAAYSPIKASETTHTKLIHSAYSKSMKAIEQGAQELDTTVLPKEVVGEIMDNMHFIDHDEWSFKPRVWTSSYSKPHPGQNCFEITDKDDWSVSLRDYVSYGAKSMPSHLIGDEIIPRKGDLRMNIDIVLEWNSQFSVGLHDYKFYNIGNIKEKNKLKNALEKIDKNIIFSTYGVGMMIDVTKVVLCNAGVVGGKFMVEKRVSMKQKCRQASNDDKSSLKATVTMIMCGGYLHFEVNGEPVCREGMKLDENVEKFVVVICAVNAQKFEIDPIRK
eukprot:153782_1